MKSELILTSSEVEDLAVCVDCAFLECFDCPRNKAKQKLKEAARDKGDVDNGIAPTADVVPVVRCEKCKHGMKMVGNSYNYCVTHNTKMRADDFCSYGERKKGDD